MRLIEVGEMNLLLILGSEYVTVPPTSGNKHILSTPTLLLKSSLPAVNFVWPEEKLFSIIQSNQALNM